MKKMFFNKCQNKDSFLFTKDVRGEKRIGTETELKNKKNAIFHKNMSMTICFNLST